MKNSKGISVLALVITVIVIIIITSITVYTGLDLVDDAQKKDASDKLKVICNELRKNDNVLGIEDAGETELTASMLKTLGLEEYYDEDRPIKVVKSTTENSIESTITYKVLMYEKSLTNEPPYTDESFSIIKSLEKSVMEISFDETEGINRPVLYEGMHAISMDGTALVSDVYEEIWYDYNSPSPKFAKMKYDEDKDGSVEDEETVYVWIPRFAYMIQNYYDGLNNPDRLYTKVPSSALQIVYLRESSKYMNNNEVVSPGYTIHPAFSNVNGEFPGFWIAMNPSFDSTTLATAVSDTSSITLNDDNVTSHLMTNSEYGAAVYLMFATNSYSQVNLIEENEFVAGVVDGTGTTLNIASVKFVDLYDRDDPKISFGDAMIETNWDRYVADYPTVSKPCIVRLMKTGYFDFTSVTEMGSNYHYRPVIINK